MFIRLGSFAVKPGALEALRKTWRERCVPVVKAAAGNVDAFLMESADSPMAAAVCTMWNTEDDAKRYEAGGTAQQVVAMVREHFAGPPKLESFKVA